MPHSECSILARLERSHVGHVVDFRRVASPLFPLAWVFRNRVSPPSSATWSLLPDDDVRIGVLDAIELLNLV